MACARAAARAANAAFAWTLAFSTIAVDSIVVIGALLFGHAARLSGSAATSSDPTAMA